MMVFLITAVIIIVVILAYFYKAYLEYNVENVAKAKPIAEQIYLVLEDYGVQEKEMFVRNDRVDVYDEFASMFCIKQEERTWDFYYFNKKTQSDRTRCHRVDLSFHCKNRQKLFLILSPISKIELEAIKEKKGLVNLPKDKFGETFLLESNNDAAALAFLNEETRSRMLEIFENNKGHWRVQNNTVSYEEPMDLDSEEKRINLRKIIDLGFDMANEVDA
jgi:hypothetical protein